MIGIPSHTHSHNRNLYSTYSYRVSRVPNCCELINNLQKNELRDNVGSLRYSKQLALLWAVNIHYFFNLSLQAQNLSSQQILPTLTSFFCSLDWLHGSWDLTGYVLLISLFLVHFLFNFFCSFHQSINQRNFYSAPYKTWTVALDYVNI